MPTDAAGRLQTCFLAVFPTLSPAAVATASPETVPDWDSIHHVTLVNVIEEEFGILIDPENLDDLTSWKSFLEYVESNG